MGKYLGKKYVCHFCGRSNSLHELKEENAWVCSKCWELIAIIASKWYEAGAKVLPAKEEHEPTD